MRLLLLVALLFAAAGGSNSNNNSNINNPDIYNDYEIYSVIDTVKELKGNQAATLYDLLEVSPAATVDEIDRIFRRLSVRLHPDKHVDDPALPAADQRAARDRAERLFKTMQYVRGLLRDQRGRSRYEWILHEAPGWHRQSVYLARKIRTGVQMKLSLGQVAWILVVGAVLAQLALHWIRWGIEVVLGWLGRREVAGMGEKEVKRMKKRMANGN